MPRAGAILVPSRCPAAGRVVSWALAARPCPERCHGEPLAPSAPGPRELPDPPQPGSIDTPHRSWGPHLKGQDSLSSGALRVQCRQ